MTVYPTENSKSNRNLWNEFGAASEILRLVKRRLPVTRPSKGMQLNLLEFAYSLNQVL